MANRAISTGEEPDEEVDGRVLLIDMENTEDDLADRLRALGITHKNAADLTDLVAVHLPPLSPLDNPAGGARARAPGYLRG